ncbi:MAG TPA: hypothetical protein VFO52_07070 [Longimicrobiales bacterium]|nr:hypothetical protein [Longimicrobiales bacterium]
MMRRMVVAGVLCSALYLWADDASAQRTRMSDASGPAIGLFSRGVVRAFGAPPAPPPVLITTPAMLDALCLERADAFLVLATLATTVETSAQRKVLALLRGGLAADAAAGSLLDIFVAAGAGPAEVEQLLQDTHSLLTPERPEVADVAAAVNSYNTMVAKAPPSFLSQPSAELTALRVALGRLSASANHAFAADRVFPGLESAGIHYGNDARWLTTGESIEIRGETYNAYGASVGLGERRFIHFADYNNVWVLAEQPVLGAPATVYVPLRKECDVELMPYVMEEKVIKRQSLLIK